jgi:hypothetical protein
MHAAGLVNPLSTCSNHLLYHEAVVDLQRYFGVESVRFISQDPSVQWYIMGRGETYEYVSVYSHANPPSRPSIVKYTLLSVLSICCSLNWKGRVFSSVLPHHAVWDSCCSVIVSDQYLYSDPYPDLQYRIRPRRLRWTPCKPKLPQHLQKSRHDTPGSDCVYLHNRLHLRCLAQSGHRRHVG